MPETQTPEPIKTNPSASIQSQQDQNPPGWPSGRLRLVLPIAFGGLLAVTVLAGLTALRVSREMHVREEQLRQRFLSRSEPLTILCSTIHIYNDQIQQYILSEDTQTAGPTSDQFSKVAAQIAADLSKYPDDQEPEERELLAALQQLFAEQQQMLNPMLSWKPEQRRKQGMHLLHEEVIPRHVEILEMSQRVASWNQQQQAERDRALFATFTYLQGKQEELLIAALAAGLALSLASILYILRLEREGQRRYQELARSRSELEQLSGRIVDAQESERRAISRELHDEVGQSLGALLMDVGRLSAIVPPGEMQLRDYVDRIKSVAEHTVQSVRDMALLLRPSMLDDLGLVAALEWQGREVSRRSQMEVEIQSEGVSDSLPDEYKICIYRLVQEALNNAARHSAAKNARVKVEQTSGKIVVRVEDNGRGFDPDRQRGLGLLGMQERVRHLGGNLTMNSKPGQGAILQAELPLPSTSAGTHAAWSTH